MADAPVLVWTSLEDTTADAVIRHLNERAVPVVRLDPGVEFPEHMDLSAFYGDDGVSGWRRTASRGLDLASVRSVYYRRPAATARRSL